MEEQRERKTLFRNKLQELYEIVSQFQRAYSLSMPSQLIDLVNPNSEFTPSTETVPVEQINMLVSSYAPELTDQLSELRELREEFGTVLVRRIKMGSSRNPTEVSQLREDFISKTKGITRLCEAMKIEIVSLARKYM